MLYLKQKAVLTYLVDISNLGYNEISLWNCESGSRMKTLWASNAPPLTNKTSNNSVHSLIAGALHNGEFSSLITCSSDARIRYWDLVNPHRSYIVVDNAYRTVSGSSAPASGLGTGSAFSIASAASATAQVNYICKFMEGMQVIQEFHLQDESGSSTSPTNNSASQANASKEHSTGGAFNNYHSWDPQAISPSHKDAITDICWINSCNLLASGSRDGCIKLWK
jgi:WD40 repeat protein